MKVSRYHSGKPGDSREVNPVTFSGRGREAKATPKWNCHGSSAGEMKPLSTARGSS